MPKQYTSIYLYKPILVYLWLCRIKKGFIQLFFPSSCVNRFLSIRPPPPLMRCHHHMHLVGRIKKKERKEGRRKEGGSMQLQTHVQIKPFLECLHSHYVNLRKTSKDIYR